MGPSAEITTVNLFTFLAVFAGGVVTSFTPCVFPLVPIIMGVVGASSQRSKLRGFLLSIVYVTGMAVTFSVLGIVAALTGSFFGKVQSSPLAHLVVGGLIIFFALSFMGFFTLPVFLLGKAGKEGPRTGSSFLSVLVMGMTSGLIAAPCATAVLAGLLAFVASTQNVIAGFFLLFTYAMGIGVLLVIAGTFGGALTALPRKEGLIKAAEKILAFVMMILGCYFIYKAGVLMSYRGHLL